jgi:hypothetical protein
MDYKDNWAALDGGPICQRCDKPKRNHGYYMQAYRCMSLWNSIFTAETESKVNTSFTIKKEGKNKMAKAKIVKMPKASKTESEPKSKKVGSKFSGKSTGLSVSDFQNKTIAGNKRDHLADSVIARMWRDEFPKAKEYTEKDVSGVRSAFNKGKHDNDVPAKPILEYDRDGDPIKKEKASSGPPKKTSKKSTDKAESKSALKRKKIQKEDEEEDEEALDTDSTEEDEEE